MITAIWDFLFHRHEWEVTETGPIFDDFYGEVGTWHNLRCKKCGGFSRKYIA